jgi:hypothetical protein
VTPIHFGYGGAGPWVPPPYLDASFQVELDVTAEGRTKLALATTHVALLDARGEPVAGDVGAFEVREARAHFGRRASYAFYDSPIFSGTIAPGTRTRLLIGGKLGVRLETILAAAPVAGRVTLLAAEVPVEIELGPGVFGGAWPTA